MITVLVTGGIGSGKSVACRYLETLGIPVYDSDSRAKSLYDTDPVLLSEVAEAFGSDIVSEDGRLDRSLLASRVFGDAQKVLRLNSLVHPAVLRDFIRWRSGQDTEIVVMESALAQNIPSFRELFDRVVLVVAPSRLRALRAGERDGVPPERIEERMAHQHFNEDDADAIVCNDGTLEQLYDQIDIVFSKFATFNS